MINVEVIYAAIYIFRAQKIIIRCDQKTFRNIEDVILIWNDFLELLAAVENWK